MEFLLVFFIAIAVASLSVTAGLGGGVLMVPILALMGGYPFPLIVGSVLISLTIPAFVGSVGAFRRKEIDFRLAAMFEIPTAIGAVIGANLSVSVNEGILKLLFSLVAIFLANEMRKKNNPDHDLSTSIFWKRIGEVPPFVVLEKRGATYRISLTSLISGGFVIGLLSGLLGVGGGWLKTPLLVIAFGVPATIATGTAIFMIMFTALIGGYTHFLAGNFDPLLTSVLVSGLGIGSLLGNWMKPRLNSSQLSRLIMTVLFIVAIALFFDGVMVLLQ